jgi:hypothetical protein
MDRSVAVVTVNAGFTSATMGASLFTTRFGSTLVLRRSG